MIPRHAAAQRRRPAYVSGGTQSFSVAVNGTLAAQVDVDPSSVNCSAQAQAVACTAQVDAPVGSDTFVLTLSAGSGGSGPALAIGTVTQTIVRGTNNAVAIALGGVVAATSVALAAPNPVMGTASSTAVTVTAYDASGERITGATPYASPLTLVDSDPTGATSLSVTTIAGPNDAAPVLSYDGSGFVNAAITAVLPGAQNFSAQAGTLIPYVHATEYAIPSHDLAQSTYYGGGDMVVGSDGAIWYVERSRIGRVTMAGAITEYAATAPQGITPGPDGALWFTQGPGGVGRLTTAGAFSSFPTGSAPGAAIATGSDGNLWYLTNQYPPSIVRMTTAGAMTAFPFTVPPGALNVAPTILVSAADGNLWTADYNGRLVRIGTDGSMAMFAIPSSSGVLPPASLTSAADGTLWVSANGSLARFALDGSLSASYGTNLGSTYPHGLAQASDGSFWFTGFGYAAPVASVVRFDPASNRFAQFLIPNSAAAPGAFSPTQVSAFVAGPDGNLWYSRGAAIGRIPLH